MHKLENEQYVPQRNVQQVLEYPQVHNIPQQQIPQLTQHPQLQNIRYLPPTATVTSHGGPEIIPYKQQNTTYNNQISTVTSDTGSENVVISLSDAQFKISDQDIITLLTTENTEQTRSQDTILFTQTPTLTTQQTIRKKLQQNKKKLKFQTLNKYLMNLQRRKVKQEIHQKNPQFPRKKTSILVMIVVNYLQEELMSRDTKTVDVEKDETS